MRTKRAVRGVAVVCAAMAASLVLTPALATSDHEHPNKPPGGRGGSHQTDDCVTPREYDKVKVHQTRTSVHKRFGTAGQRTSISHNGERADEVREYVVCDSPDSSVTVSYRKVAHGPFKVVSKTAVFVG
jgi:hypothetical protein